MQRVASEPIPRRAAQAVALWVGFYLLAFGIAGGLLFFAYAVFRWGGSSPPFVLVLAAAGSVVAALVIFGSSLPRWERFIPPGPRLEAERHPRLFEEIRRLARDTRQKPAVEVYLGLEATAWVMHRGGFLGFLKRRVMMVGLPLLGIMSVSRFRGILAHEFGHYAGGDTRLGPWVYRTRAALQRTLDALEGNDSLWRFPFIAYAKLFSRISLAVSRRQELAADALAARVAGARACADGLRLTHEAGAAFQAFVNEELLPVLNAGFRPAVGEGFVRFLAAEDVSRAVRKLVGREMADRARKPDQTHPPLPERLEAIAGLPPGMEVEVDPPAIDLLSGVDALETELLAAVTGNPSVRTLPTIAWDEVGAKAFLPQWREQAAEVRRHLAGVTPASFPELDLTGIGRRLRKEGSDADARAEAMRALGVALLVSLHDLGWEVRVGPGERPKAARGAVCVEPFHVFTDIAEGKLRREAWRERCEAGGFGGVELGAGKSLPEEQGNDAGGASL